MRVIYGLNISRWGVRSQRLNHGKWQETHHHLVNTLLTLWNVGIFHCLWNQQSRKSQFFSLLMREINQFRLGTELCTAERKKKKSLQTKWMPNFSVFYSPSHPKIEIFMAGGVGKTARPVWELRVNPGKQSAHISRKRNIKSLCLETPNTLDTLYFWSSQLTQFEIHCFIIVWSKGDCQCLHNIPTVVSLLINNWNVQMNCWVLSLRTAGGKLPAENCISSP